MDKRILLAHQRAKHRTFCPFFESQRFNRSEHGDPDHGFKSKLIRKYERKDAINSRYNRAACEYIILELLQEKMAKVKDSVNLFYKDVFHLIYFKEDFVTFQRSFGYKCQLIRDPAAPHYFMEVLVISEQEKSQKKVETFQDQMRFIKRSASFRKRKSNQGILRAWAENEQQRKKPEVEPSKLMKALAPEEFHTDESMANINYDDVRSYQSKSESEESEYVESSAHELSMCKHKIRRSKKKQQKRLKDEQKSIQIMLLSNEESTPALEYYNALMKKDITVSPSKQGVKAFAAPKKEKGEDGLFKIQSSEEIKEINKSKINKGKEQKANMQ